MGEEKQQAEEKQEHPQRPNWDEYFAGVVLWVGTRGACCRRENGAVIVKGKEIIATGYNSTPRGLENCLEIGICKREDLGLPTGERYELCRAEHAEANAIIQLAWGTGGSIGTKMYVIRYPCIECARDIIQSGIIEVVYLGGKESEESKLIFEKANIKVRKLDFSVDKLINYLAEHKKYLERE